MKLTSGVKAVSITAKMGNKNCRAAQTKAMPTQPVKASAPKQSKAVQSGPKRQVAPKLPQDTLNARCIKAGHKIYSSDPEEVKRAYAFLWDVEFKAGESHRLYLTNGGIYRHFPATDAGDIAAGKSYVKKLWLPKLAVLRSSHEIFKQSAAVVFADILFEVDFSFRRFEHPDKVYNHQKLVEYIGAPLYSPILAFIKRITVRLELPAPFADNRRKFYDPQRNYADVEALVELLNDKLDFNHLERFNVVIVRHAQAVQNDSFALPFYELDFEDWRLWIDKGGENGLELADAATISRLDKQSFLGPPDFAQFNRVRKQRIEKKQKSDAVILSPAEQKAKEIAERGVVVIR